MSKGKWGESFLKSGLPLEHLTLATFKSLGWICDPHIEYERANEREEETWFEIDLDATFPEDNNDTELSFLVECKYHDLSRFWFFLPCDIEDRWHFNDRVFNCGPYQTLVEPRSPSALKLAPTSNWGIVVSEDGQKQDNAVSTAIQQLVNGFVPYSLSRMFDYNLSVKNGCHSIVTALIPMIVTNARIYRLRPEVSDLEVIRKSSSPDEIADEVEWTWCYYDPSHRLCFQNMVAIEVHKETRVELINRFPYAVDQLNGFEVRPNWIVVANMRSLATAANTILEHFFSLQTISLEEILRKQNDDCTS